MKKFGVAIPWFATVFVEVEAKNKEEAIEKAMDDLYPTLCHQCTNEVELGEMNSFVEPEVYEV